MISTLRRNMVEQQIRPWGVTDENVLTLLEEVNREDFIPPVYRNLAFVDMETPLKPGVATLPPKVEARLLQALDVRSTDRVLEVGTGCGYLTALLARQAAHVYSVEIDADLFILANHNLKAIGLTNITMIQGDASRGWPEYAPFDVMAFTGSLPVLPTQLESQLAPAGRLFVIIGTPPAMTAMLFQKQPSGQLHAQPLFETVTAPLEHALQPETFQF